MPRFPIPMLHIPFDWSYCQTLPVEQAAIAKHLDFRLMPKLRIDHCKANLKIRLRLLQFNY